MDQTANGGDAPAASSGPGSDLVPGRGAAWPARGSRNVRWTAVAVAAVVAVGLLLVAVTWWQGRSTTDTAAVPTNPGPVVMAEADLPQLVTFTGHTIYWAGDQGLDTYEVTISPSTEGQQIYIRYLPKGVDAGSKDAYLTVGTYEKKNAYAGLEAAAKLSGAKSEKLAGGALVVQPAGKTTSAYFGFQGADLLMEVYDPTPGKALQLIQSGTIQPL